jgi:carboxymethylenebutenolidase
MEIYDAEPSGIARGAVIVLQEAFGVNVHIESVTRRFAASGYRAIAPHIYHRTGDPVIDYKNVEAMMPHRQALTEEGLLQDLDAALNYLSDAGFSSSSVGVVGFCLGGTITFLAAVRYALGAAVTFYGGGIVEGGSPLPSLKMPTLLEISSDLQTPWLGLYGDLDILAPVEQVELLRKAVANSQVPTSIVRYAEANHGFHCDIRDSYHETSAKDAWRRTLEWLETHLSKQ